jgi:hypothetical protein
MTPPPNRSGTWKLDAHDAALEVGPIRASINLERPDLGLHALQQDAAPIEGSLLAVSSDEDRLTWPAKIVDAYVRGNDVVATYAGESAWPYAPQIYWSAGDNHSTGGTLSLLSLVVSIQTNLLDTYPRLFARSRLQTDEVLSVSVAGDELLVDSHADGAICIDPRATACGQLCRLPGGKFSYAEILLRTDFRRLFVQRSGAACSLQWELFSEFLEKGVIRRARLQSLLVPRDNDVQLVAECCQAIEKRPLPLTT